MEAASGTAPCSLSIDHDGFKPTRRVPPDPAPANAKMIERMKQSNPPSPAWAPGSQGRSWRAAQLPVVEGPRSVDPFFPGADADAPGGRLLLVAPNIVAIERELDVEPSDFRLWVCLHEETHRVQFGAVPWLRGYLNTQIAQIVDSAELDPAIVAQMLRDALSRVMEGVMQNQEVSIIDLVQTPAQRETVERVTAVMSLLEGHADVVMDGVGPEVIPTVETIRAKFTVRRQGQGFDKIIRKLLGLDAKMRQYRDGAKFCRAVMAEAGMSGLNRSGPLRRPCRQPQRSPTRGSG